MPNTAKLTQHFRYVPAKTVSNKLDHLNFSVRIDQKMSPDIHAFLLVMSPVKMEDCWVISKDAKVKPMIIPVGSWPGISENAPARAALRPGSS
jgi:hypothetical protein